MSVEKLDGADARPFKPQFEAISRDCFNAAVAARRVAVWDWLFATPATAGGHDAFVLVARRGDGEAVGALMMIPDIVQAGDEDWVAHHACSLMVRPGRRGPGLALVRSLYANTVRSLGTPLDMRNQRAYERYARITATRQMRHFRLLRPGRIAVRRKGLGAALAALAGAVDAVWGAGVALGRALRHPGQGLAFEEVASFGAEFDELWQRARHGYPFILRRDAAYLNWRYRDFPFDEYRSVLLRREGEPAGYVVTRLDERNGRRELQISDIFCARDDRTALRALLYRAEARALEARAELITLELTRGVWARRHLRGAGYLMSRPASALLMHSEVPDEQAFLETVVEDAYYTRGDSDQDY